MGYSELLWGFVVPIRDVYGTVLSLVRLAPLSHTDFAKILKVRNTPE